MKYFLFLLIHLFSFTLAAQTLQLHYDVGHSLDPVIHAKNFPSLYFEYFKAQDSGKQFIKPGAFLFKMQADLTGSSDNAGKVYMQVAQTLRFWHPKIFLHLSYSGGLGVTEPKQYSYYIVNTFSVGAAYPFQWKGGYYTLVADYRYVPYSKPTSDLLWTFYFYKAFFNYRLELLGDFSCWTENRDHGDAFTAPLSGKAFFAYGEPQLWWRLAGPLSAGTKINIYYHVNTPANTLQIDPAIGIRWKL